MPHVRHTPKRRRHACPACGRDVAYTHPWVPSSRGGLERDYRVAVFTNHNTPEGAPCPVNGPHGFGTEVTW